MELVLKISKSSSQGMFICEHCALKRSDGSDIWDDLFCQALQTERCSLGAALNKVYFSLKCLLTLFFLMFLFCFVFKPSTSVFLSGMIHQTLWATWATYKFSLDLEEMLRTTTQAEPSLMLEIPLQPLQVTVSSWGYQQQWYGRYCNGSWKKFTGPQFHHSEPALVPNQRSEVALSPI